MTFLEKLGRHLSTFPKEAPKWPRMQNTMKQKLTPHKHPHTGLNLGASQDAPVPAKSSDGHFDRTPITSYSRAIEYLQRAPKPVQRRWAEEFILNLCLAENDSFTTSEHFASPYNPDLKNDSIQDAILGSVNGLTDHTPLRNQEAR